MLNLRPRMNAHRTKLRTPRSVSQTMRHDSQPIFRQMNDHKPHKRIAGIGGSKMSARQVAGLNQSDGQSLRVALIVDPETDAPDVSFRKNVTHAACIVLVLVVAVGRDPVQRRIDSAESGREAGCNRSKIHGQLHSIIANVVRRNVVNYRSAGFTCRCSNRRRYPGDIQLQCIRLFVSSRDISQLFFSQYDREIISYYLL